MSLTQPIMNLEKTSSIPQGSTFVVEMGDGSGTKAVTKENLEKSTGEALKIGNLEELQTEAKGSIVAAINEAAQLGSGGSAVDILDTKEEIEANTESGKAAGAQAVKEMFSELNDKLKGFEPVIDENTGKMTGYKTAVGGADTVFPFSTIQFSEISSSNTSFSPKIETVGNPHFILAAVTNKSSCIYAVYSDGSIVPEINKKSQADISVEDDGFQVRYNVRDGFTGTFSWAVSYV